MLTILGLAGITIALYKINNRESLDEGEQMLPIPADFKEDMEDEQDE